jgi:hypothetical protein
VITYTAPVELSVENKLNRSYVLVGEIEGGEKITASLVLKEEVGPIVLSLTGTSTAVTVNGSFDSENLPVIFSDFEIAEKVECICEDITFTDGVPSLRFTGELIMNLTTSTPVVSASLIHQMPNTDTYAFTNTLQYPVRYKLSIPKPEDLRNATVLVNNQSIGSDLSFTLFFDPRETKILTLVYSVENEITLESQLSTLVADLQATLPEVIGLATPSQIDQAYAIEMFLSQNHTLQELNEKVSEAEQLLRDLRLLKAQQYLVPERAQILALLGDLRDQVEDAYDESVITQHTFTSLTGKISEAESLVSSVTAKFSDFDNAQSALSTLGIELTSEITSLYHNVSERVDLLRDKVDYRNLTGINYFTSNLESDTSFLNYLMNQYLSSITSILRDSLKDKMETLSDELSELSERDLAADFNQAYKEFSEAYIMFQRARFFSGKRDYLSALPLYLEINLTLSSLHVSERLTELNEHLSERVAEVYREIGDVSQKLNQLGYISQSEEYEYASFLLQSAHELIEEEKPDEAQALVTESEEVLSQALSDIYTKEDNSRLGMNVALMLISSISFVFVSQKKRLFGI